MTIARDLHLADVAVALRGGRREPGLGAVGGAAARRRLRRRGGRGRGHRRDRRRRPGRRAPRQPRTTRASWSRASPTSGSSWPAAARRCPATRSSASSPAPAGSACTARTAPTPRTCAQQPERVVEVSWKPTVGVDVPGRDPGRGARPAQAARRRHPGALRGAGQHPVRDGHHDPRPGGGEPVQLRDGRPEAPRATCWPRCARSTASSTPTGSPPAPDGRACQVSYSSGRRIAGPPTCRPSGTARPFGSSHASWRPSAVRSRYW